jgi:hypothetical protein
MTEDYVTEAVFDFLENGGELPADASKNPQSRFVFQTAIARETYQKSCSAIDKSNKAMKVAHATSDEFVSFKEVVNTKIQSLVDKVDVRLGLVGGIIVAANVALFFLVKLLP